MNTRRGMERIPSADLGLAVVLLAGVVTIGYGYLQANRIAFFSGLAVIVAGTCFGVLRLVVHRDGAR